MKSFTVRSRTVTPERVTKIELDNNGSLTFITKNYTLVFNPTSGYLYLSALTKEAKEWLPQDEEKDG